MVPYALFVQSLALIAVAFFVVSFHAKARKKILILQLIGLAIWIIHFILLSAYTGAALLLVNAVITVALIYKVHVPEPIGRAALIAALGVIAIASALAWEGLYSVFAFLAVSAITIAKWQDDPQKLRILAIFASLFWITYDAYVGSIGGIISEGIMLASIAVSLVSKRKF